MTLLSVDVVEDSLDVLLELVPDVLDVLESPLQSLALLLALEPASDGSCSMRSYRLMKYFRTHFPALSRTLSLKCSFFLNSHSLQSPSL